MIVSSITVIDNTGVLIANPITMNVNGAPVLGWLNGDPITVPDDIPCVIRISKSGYFAFENTFTFWTIPVGNYPNMDVYLTELIAPTDVKASFYPIRKPCSTDFCLYNTSSCNYTTIQWNWGDGSPIATGFNTCKTMGLFGKVFPEQIITNGVNTDTYSDKMIVYQFIPEVSYTISCPNEPPTPDCLNAGIGTMTIGTGPCIFTVY